MGEVELPAGYKITALKMIATLKIKEQIDLQEHKIMGSDANAKYRALRDMALNMSRNIHGKGRITHGCWDDGSE